MDFFSKRLRTLCYICLVIIGFWTRGICETPSGYVEGHLRIFSAKEVQLGGATSSKVAMNYADYPLIIRNAGGKEVTRVAADEHGKYRVALPLGDYILDVQGRRPGGVRAKPQPFTIASNQTVQVDMDIDTGVR